ncbi:MAG: 1-deoxy-D-xylulose-5-phosphate synthase, partial [Chloroflexi bacterium]|nr:1-deoxy-D-xylulose-5-phosphate synthase [Chloroflexota bacterium]
FGSAVLEMLCNARLDGVKVECLGLPDRFIEHGTQEFFRSVLKLDGDGIARHIRASFPELLARHLPGRRQ